MSTELKMLEWAIGLGLVQILVVTVSSILRRGLIWNMGPRDHSGKPFSPVAARLERALQNFKESFPLFLGAVFLVQILGKNNSTSEWGSQIYFWCRLIYVPVYASGILGVRTVLWLASIVGIVMVLCAAC